MDARLSLIRRTEKSLRETAGFCARAGFNRVSDVLVKLADAWRPYLTSSAPQVAQKQPPRSKRPVPNRVKQSLENIDVAYQPGGRLHWFAAERAKNRSRNRKRGGK